MGNGIARAIFSASAVTSPGERPCALALTEIWRLPSECWIWLGALPIVTVAICSSGTIRLVPEIAIGSRSMLEDRRNDLELTAAVRAVLDVDLESETSAKTNLYSSYVAAKTRLSKRANITN